MKSQKKYLSGTFLVVLLIVFTFQLSARDYYQLKIYNLKDHAQEARVENYLKNAYLPALHRAGIKKVGVFKPIESDDKAGKKIIVFIPMKKPGDLVKIESKLAKDTQYQAAGSEYINAKHDNPPYERIESILLKAFSEMPEFGVPDHKTPPKERIYELRSYEGPTEQYYRKKVEMFNEGGEIDLFKRLDFQAVFYGEVISGNTMPNLMYMTTFSDMKSHGEHWNTFRTHPEWETMKTLEKYKNTVSRSEIQLLHPTEYSDI
jgi:uncharacterized protein YpmB